MRWLIAGVACTVAVLAWVGYRAAAEWEHSEALLAQRRADAATDLMVTAITRDMRGVQESALPSLQFDETATLLDLDAVGSVFARYPYPEAFFAGTGGLAHAAAVRFYSRTERPPAWLPTSADQSRFTVVVSEAPALSRRLCERIRLDAAARKRFSIFDLSMPGGTYQVVTAIRYADSLREHVGAVVGFVVNLDWVEHHYFNELVTQVMRIQATEDDLTPAILDSRQRAVVGQVPRYLPTGSSSRRFPMLFFDPDLIVLDPPPDLERPYWSARASVADGRLITAHRTMSIAMIDVVVLTLGLTLTILAARAKAKLESIRSEFLSAVTHELKTPVSTIRAVGETLASGRSNRVDAAREYGRITVKESRRLTRLVDNLLAYARITDVTEAYTFEPLKPAEVIADSLKEFSSQLAVGEFFVETDVPADLPAIRADRPSLLLALGNLIENAIQYSLVERSILIRARATTRALVIELIDHGSGIPEHELPHVTQKNFRGQAAIPGGSGLGLSIVQRIISDHGGTLSIVSSKGTTVVLTLPLAKEAP